MTITTVGLAPRCRVTVLGPPVQLATVPPLTSAQRLGKASAVNTTDPVGTRARFSSAGCPG